MQLLITLAAFLFVISVVVVFHELGHFLVAKSFGVRVTVFSVGFGKKVFGIKPGETEYRFSRYPLGGYVKLYDDPFAESDDPRAFINKPRWQKLLIVWAGPVASAILGVVMMAGIFMTVGNTVTGHRLSPVIGGVVSGSVGELAGLQAEDKIISIEGKGMKNWDDVSFIIGTSPNRATSIVFERNGDTLTAVVTPKAVSVAQQTFGDAGLLPKNFVHISFVEPDSPAEEAGLQERDELIKVDDLSVTVATFDKLVAYINEHPNAELSIVVRRGDSAHVLTVTPRMYGETARIGVQFSAAQRYGFFESFSESMRYNANLLKRNIEVFGKMFKGEMSPSNTISGPIGIASISGEMARRGFVSLISLTANISMFLAFFNLLPIPGLDGGHILIFAIESVIRKDLSKRVKTLLMQLGFLLILFIFVLAMLADLAKIIF